MNIILYFSYMKNLLTSLFCLFCIASNAQYTFEVFPKHGIYFKVGPRLELEEVKENGKKTTLMGSANYRVKLLDLAFLPVPTDISYKGKNYNYNDFAGQLQPYFKAARVVDASMKVFVDGLEDCKEFSVNYLRSKYQTFFCKPIPNRRIAITGFKLSDIEVVGINELQRKIDELEQGLKDKEKKERITQMVVEADQILGNEKWEEAIAAYEMILQQDPSNDAAKEGKLKARERQLEAEKKAAQEKRIADSVELAARQVQQKTNTAVPKKELEKQPEVTPKNNIDSSMSAHKRMLDDRWKVDSAFYADQRKIKAAQQQESKRLGMELTKDYQDKLASAFAKAKKQFALLSDEEQAKACQQAVGYASNAELFSQMQEYNSACKLYQQAALTCPTHPLAEFNWLVKSVVDFGSMMGKADKAREKAEQTAAQKQDLRLLEISNAYSNAPFVQLYEKYRIEQGYKKMYEQAKADADQYYNQFSKMGDVAVRFTDPASLNSFINTRIKAVDANYQRSLQAAGIKAGAEFDQTYAATGNAKTAATAGAVSGATDILANSIVAGGAKKRLREERENQINEIAFEFVTKLNENSNYYLRRMLTAQTKEEDEKAYADFLYNYYRHNNACSRFSYANNDWYYATGFSTASEVQNLRNIQFIDQQPELQEAERKLFFSKKLAGIKKPVCNNINVISNFSLDAASFKMEAEAWIAKALRNNPGNPVAYHLLAQMEDYWPRYYNYAYMAAQLSAKSDKQLFTGYKQKTDRLFIAYLNQLVEKPTQKNRDEWATVLQYKLYQQLPKEDITALVDKMVREELVVFLKLLIDSDNAFRSKELIHGLLLDAIRLNKRATAFLLSAYMDVNTSFVLNQVAVNYWQLAVIENKTRAFTGLIKWQANFTSIAEGMKPFEGQYPAENLFHAFSAAALWYNITEPLEYIQRVAPSYLSQHTEIADTAISLGGRPKVIQWLSAQKYINTQKLSLQLYQARSYADIQSLLELGADVNVKAPGKNSFLYDKLNKSVLQWKEDVAYYAKTGNDGNRAEFFKWFARSGQLFNIDLALLLKYKADVFAVADDNSTVFHMAAAIGVMQSVKRLLLAAKEKGEKQTEALLNVQNRNGNTALHIAVMNKHAALAALLIHAGADPGIRNNEGRTARKLADDMNLPIPRLSDMNPREMVGYILSEEQLVGMNVNKRAIPADANSLNPLPQLYNLLYPKFQSFSKKTFKTGKEVLSDNYFRTADFLDVVKYKLLNRPLVDRDNREVYWLVEDLDDIQSLRFVSIKAINDYSYETTFEIYLKNTGSDLVKMTANISLVLFYVYDKNTLAFGNPSFPSLYGAQGQVYTSNVSLAKTIAPGGSTMFYQPKGFLPSNSRIKRTDFIRDTYAKHNDSEQDVLQRFFYRAYQIDDYKNLTDRPPSQKIWWNPEFILVENREKNPITITAYWK